MALQFRRGLDADRTSITPLPGEPLWITDTDELYVGDGSTAGGVLITGGGGGGAPTNATYIVQTSNGTLTNEQALASLATGILKNTTTTGVLSIATGSDLPSHTHTLADITDDGTMAAQNANNVAITGGSLAGVTVTTGTYSSNVNEAIMHAVRKASAGTISKGDVIRITGSSGTHLQVELADASVEATSSGTIGIAATTITNSTTGYMMVAGELTGLSNVPTASFTDGAALWLSETTGAFTTTRPTQPNHGVFLGWVVAASNGSAGRIYVKVINYSELNELHDVLISGVADNHFLVYDNATSLWKNESPSDARTSLGLGTVATESTVPINKGGTGQTTATAAFDALAPTTTKGDIIVFDGTDNIRLAVGGTNDHVLTVDSSTATGLKWAAASGGGSGGTKTYAVFTPLDAQPPASNFATLDTRVDIAVLEFDAGTEESTTFVGVMPEGASLGSGLKVRLHWMSLDQTSNSVVWGVQFQELIDDVDTAAYDTEQTGTTATSGSGAGTVNVTEITITTIDSVSAGDAFRLKVARKAADGSDTMSNDAQLIAVEVRSAA
jgi:hypothetical protein